ncbi:MAG TPA: hypothetical protein VFF73_10025 [Planctomycetota bacterium]|nr:hypothetical protein [Planctomycetota bacterium]
MIRALPAALLLVATGLARADDLDAILARHRAERAPIARIGSRTVAARELAPLLEQHAAELRGYAETAPVASASLARERATREALEAASLRLELDPASTEPGLAVADARTFAVLVERASGESQEKLVSVLEARLRSRVCPANVRARLDAGAGAVILDPEEARSVGVRWGRVELIVDASGSVKGVDLVGDERQNLLRELGSR